MATSQRTWRYFTIGDQEATAESSEKPVQVSRLRSIANHLIKILTLPFHYLLPYLSQILVLLWLAPIVSLLGLNLSNYSIGASAWCWHKKCFLNPFDGYSVYQLAQKFDKQDHNLLGALQFVAKALEIWFGFIAANLVYTITIIIASQPHGIPIGFLATFAEYKDFVFLAAPFRWSAPTVFSKMSNTPRFLKSKMILFLTFAAFMAIIANLMGPAVAVLVLPTLSWTEKNVTAVQQFTSLGIDEGPQGVYNDPSIFLNCSPGDLQNRWYSCTQYPYESILDAWVSFSVAESQQNYTPASDMPGISQSGISQELGVTFTFNSSQPDAKKNASAIYKNWVPNRQVLRSISSDLDGYLNNLEPVYTNNTRNTTLIEHSNHTRALQTTLKREGPLLGTVVNIYAPQIHTRGDFTKDGEQEKFVRCYDGWFSSDFPDLIEKEYGYTRCVRYGLGWSPNNRNASFNISTSSNPADPSASVIVYFADRGTYLQPANGPDQNATIAGSLSNSTSISPNCLLTNGSASDVDCNWSEITPATNNSLLDNGSEKPEQGAGLRRLTDNITVVEVSYNNQLVVFEFFSFWIKSAYMLDTSAGSNPLYLVQTDGIPDNDIFNTSVVHPDWLLAAWSVDEGGTVPYERAASSSISAGLMANNYSCAAYNDCDDSYQFYNALSGILLSYLQALSMVPYNYAEDSGTFQTHNTSRPIFHTASEIREWGFGLGTRTSKLGVVVVLIGCVCALVQTALSAWKPPHQRSLTELLLAALEYQSQKGELVGTGQEEDKAGMILYRMGPDEQKNNGQFRFKPV